VVRDIGCRPLETVMGRAIAQLATAGEYQPNGQAANRWYRSHVAFVLE
jgi:hypothetical protein